MNKEKLKQIVIYLALMSITIFMGSWAIGYIIEISEPVICQIEENQFQKLLGK